MVQQIFDIAALIPTGVLADRQGAARVLPVVLLLMAAANAMIGSARCPWWSSVARSSGFRCRAGCCR